MRLDADSRASPGGMQRGRAAGPLAKVGMYYSPHLAIQNFLFPSQHLRHTVFQCLSAVYDSQRLVHPQLLQC